MTVLDILAASYGAFVVAFLFAAAARALGGIKADHLPLVSALTWTVLAAGFVGQPVYVVSQLVIFGEVIPPPPHLGLLASLISIAALLAICWQSHWLECKYGTLATIVAVAAFGLGLP